MALHLPLGSGGPVRLWADSDQGARWQRVVDDAGPSTYRRSAAPLRLFPGTLSSSFDCQGSSRAKGKQRRQLDYFRAIAREAGIDEIDPAPPKPSFRPRLVTLPYNPQAVARQEHTALPTSDTLLVAWAGGPEGTDLYMSSLSPRPRVLRAEKRRLKRRRYGGDPMPTESTDDEESDLEEDLDPAKQLADAPNVVTFSPELIPAYSFGHPISRITAAPLSPSPGAFSRHAGPWLIVQTAASTILGSIEYNAAGVRKTGVPSWSLRPMAVLDAPGFARPAWTNGQAVSAALDASIADSAFHPEMRNSALLVDRLGGLHRWDFDQYDVSLYDRLRWTKSLRFSKLAAPAAGTSLDGLGHEDFWRIAWASDGHQALLFERTALWSVDTRAPDRQLRFETHRLARSTRRAVFTSAVASPGAHPSCWASTTDAVLLFDLRNTSLPVFFAEHGRGEDMTLTLTSLPRNELRGGSADEVILSSGRSRLLQHFSASTLDEERSIKAGPPSLLPTGLGMYQSPASPPNLFDPSDVGFKWQDWVSDVSRGSQRACCMLEQGPDGAVLLSVLRQDDERGTPTGEEDGELRPLPIHIARSARLARLETEMEERRTSSHAGGEGLTTAPRFDLSTLHEALFELPEPVPLAKARRQLRTAVTALQSTEEPLDGVITGMDLLHSGDLDTCSSAFGLASVTAETLLASQSLFEELRVLDASLSLDSYGLDLAPSIQRRFCPLLRAARVGRATESTEPQSHPEDEASHHRALTLDRWPHLAHALASAYSPPSIAGRPSKAAVGARLAIQTASEQVALDLVLAAKAGAMDPILCPRPDERERLTAAEDDETLDGVDEQEAPIPPEPFETNLSYEAQQVCAALRDLGLRPSLREPAVGAVDLSAEHQQGVDDDDDEARLQMPSVPPLHFSFFAPRPSVSRGRRNRITPGASLLLHSWTLGTPPSAFRATNPYAAFDAESDFTSGTESDASSRSWHSNSRTPAGSRTPMSSRTPSVPPMPLGAGQAFGGIYGHPFGAPRAPMAPPSIDAAGSALQAQQQPPSIGAAPSLFPGPGFSASQPSTRSQWRATGSSGRAVPSSSRLAKSQADDPGRSTTQAVTEGLQPHPSAQSQATPYTQQTQAQTQVLPGAFGARRKGGGAATSKGKGKKRMGGF